LGDAEAPLVGAHQALERDAVLGPVGGAGDEAAALAAVVVFADEADASSVGA
jgi:hypothetical protein